MNASPYDFNDLDLAAYKDENNVVWCFTSDMFDSLLSGKINPHNQMQLPETFIRGMKQQRSMIKRLGIPVKPPQPYADAIDDLKKKDIISDERSIAIVQAFDRMAILHAVTPEEWRSLSPSTMEKILQSIGATDVNLESLTNNHAQITFARVAHRKIKDRPETSKLLFSRLKE